MYLEDYITIIMIVVVIDICFMATTISFCNFMITKKIANGNNIAEEKQRKNRKNYEKSKDVKIKESIWQKIARMLFINEEDDDYDSEFDEFAQITTKNNKKNKYSKKSLDTIPDEELNKIIAEAKKELSKKEAEGELYLPKYSDKILPIKRPKAFQYPQELVDYIAAKHNAGSLMDVYDKKNNIIREVQSFKASYGELYIYYKHFSIPDKFEPGRFSRVA